MSNHEQLEKQLRSWTPQRPSDKVARRLFGKSGSLNVWAALQTPDLWNWLTPAAACLITMLVFLSGGYQRSSQAAPSECATFYATVMLNASHTSNAVGQTFSMNRKSVNMEWNVIPGFSYNGAALEPAAYETNAVK